MPKQIRGILIASNENLTQLATLADKLFDLQRPQQTPANSKPITRLRRFINKNARNARNQRFREKARKYQVPCSWQQHPPSTAGKLESSFRIRAVENDSPKQNRLVTPGQMFLQFQDRSLEDIQNSQHPSNYTQPTVQSLIRLEKNLTLDLGLRADFLCRHGILVDLRRKRLIGGFTLFSFQASVDILKTPNISTDLLKEYLDITRPNSRKDAAPDIQHYIITTGCPVAEPARRLNLEKLKVAKALQAAPGLVLCILYPKKEELGDRSGIIDA
ncbi:hypothetical protein ABEB36_002971 [Hypothenemus hampei]|uniref:Uncharacterized protein n=1 Tax=Hypothenemus hampei TaxID=57062 RepID=A0ABD1F7L6_HYPHA